MKIEDILPFFPDFVTIDNFKGAITDSLTRYNRQIEELKAEMDEATEIAGGQTVLAHLTQPCRCSSFTVLRSLKSISTWSCHAYVLA